ncbi:MAG: transposase [Bacteroidota bacterium]|nr:transposase [Bacteroidota bacterium]
MLLNYHTEFLTTTIYNWNHLLREDCYKQIIINSFDWLYQNKKCTINCFVIMPNHIHLLWKISDGFERKEVQGAFLSFTAHEFKKHLKKNAPKLLEDYYVNKSDRSFQFWEREPMVKECWTEKFFRQKFNYIHFNPCQPHWNLASLPEDYKWSSANFYEKGIKDFTFLTDFR